MPGYMIHLCQGQEILRLLEQRGFIKSKDAHYKKLFLIGSLLPDSNSDKQFSHFRDEKQKNQIVVSPNLDLFRKEYDLSKNNPVMLGYYAHLCLDKTYLEQYLPNYVRFMNSQQQDCLDEKEVSTIFIKKENREISVKDFFSSDYFYGDYSKSNQILMEKFCVSLEVLKEVENGSFHDLPYEKIPNMIAQLEKYMSNVESKEDLRIFEINSLIEFIQKSSHNITEEIIKIEN